MNPVDARWHSFKFWNRVGIFSVLAFLPTLAGLALLLHWWRLEVLSFLVVLLAAAWVTVIGLAYFQIRAFRCPRCTKPFAVKHPLGSNTRGRKCVHCGLKLYSAIEASGASSQ
jgi:DNA-directed RNA polymerase subunit RPC12/RpoP